MYLYTVARGHARQQDDQRGSPRVLGRCADAGGVRPWGECDCLESPRFHTFDDGVSIDGPMRRPDAFSMQSVRHTSACISVGGWYVQGVEIAWPSVSGASHICSPWASPHRVSASAHSPWAQAVGTAQDQVWHFWGHFGGAAQCLTGQTASVHGVLAGFHIHTGRLRWRDFGFEFLAAGS